MSAAPAPAPVARRRGGRPRLLDSLRDPLELDVYSTGPLCRRVPICDDIDPARQRWIELLLTDPAAAKRELLEQRLQYWRSRLEKLQARLRQAEAALAAARKRQYEDGEIRCTPPAAVWELAAARGAAWADCEAARAELQRLERELAGLAQA